MQEAFYAVFLVAFAFTIYSFFMLEQDMKEKSYRPAYLLFISAIAWFTTIGLIITPSTNTLTIPAYNITTANVPLNCAGGSILTACGTTTEVIQYPAITQTTAQNSPLPTYAFYEYMAFAGAMSILCIVFLIMFMMKMSVDEIKDAGKSLLD